jgi:predicted transcriptional regulator
MRTTVEISDEQRARLLELAARRGEKGFSSLVRDALDAFLAREAAQEAARRRALSLRGRLSREAPALRAHVRRVRASWR